MTAEHPPSAHSAQHKTFRDENFPVASFLLPKKIRPHVLAFYSFARAADDVADCSNLASAEKLAFLDAMEQVLHGEGREAVNGLPDGLDAPARALRQSLIETGVSEIYACELLAAFRLDATQSTTETWADLMAYCRLSAAPVGRYLIELSGGPREGHADDCIAASDALCAALQVLNHLQDIKPDHQMLARVYLPQVWLQGEGVFEAELEAASASAGLRRVMDRTLSEVDALLDLAKPLGHLIAANSLAREAAGIHALATALSDHLKRCDPLSERVELSKFATAWRFLLGALRQ